MSFGETEYQTFGFDSTSGLEEIFKRLNWEEKGIRILGRCLSHLRFADDIIIIANNPRDLQQMVEQLNESSKLSGMKINRSKTKILFNKFVNPSIIHLEGENLEVVNNYVYLGQNITMENEFAEEISSRINRGWRSFGQNSDIFKSNIPMSLKRKLYNQCTTICCKSLGLLAMIMIMIMMMIFVSFQV